MNILIRYAFQLKSLHTHTRGITCKEMSSYTLYLLAYSLVIVSVASASRYDARCMEDGNGCTIDDLKNEVDEMDSNVYQVLSWNIEGESVNDVCRTLSQLPDLMVSSILFLYYLHSEQCFFSFPSHVLTLTYTRLFCQGASCVSVFENSCKHFYRVSSCSFQARKIQKFC